jgi:hypothetical protein
MAPSHHPRSHDVSHPATFCAFVAEKVAGSDPAHVERGVREFHEADLAARRGQIQVAWSSVKLQGRAGHAGGREGRPDQPVDRGSTFAGVVVSSVDGAIPAGTEVLAHG